MSRAQFQPLSDEDEDFSNFSLGNESPVTEARHSRQGSDDAGGHFYIGPQSTAGKTCHYQATPRELIASKFNRLLESWIWEEDRSRQRKIRFLQG